MTPPDWGAATRHVVRADPSFRDVVERVGPIRIRGRSRDSFGALAASIVYQQLAGRAAAAIHGRFVALFPGSRPTPEAVLAASEPALRSAGLSGAKAAAIRDLAAKVLDGTVPIRWLGRLDDDELIERLSRVRGIGRWTAEMFLIFQLQRPDVWPVDDLGVRRGWQLVHGGVALPVPKALALAGEPFRPHRTAAAWYCWQAVHLSRGEI
jgi:DNA-3-methyladenine glycosylase II